MTKYIVIPDIKVTNANAQPVWWMISAPSLTAYAGFAHALALKLEAKGHKGVAAVHHNIQFLGEELTNQYGGRAFLPHQFRAAGLIDKNDYPAGSMSLSSQPTARCHLNISLVIAMADDVKLLGTKVESFLRGARIAGGSIINHGEVVCGIATHREALEHIRKESGKTGYSIVERQDLMKIQDQDRDMVDVVLRHTRRYAPESKTHQNTDDNEKSESTAWVVPTCLGYAGISPIKERSKSRKELPHLYVEPLVGLVQYSNSRDGILQFWRYTHPQPNVFVLSINKEL